MQQLPLGMRWRESSTFANFVRGGNAMAVEQLQNIAGGTATALWVWGPESSGRTHLLQASCASAGEAGRRVAYFPMLERADFTPATLNGCETLDLVCIDDVQALAGEPTWERALFNLYNGLQEQGGRLLLAASEPPAALQWSLPDLKSRLTAALVLHLQPLDDGEIAEVLRLRARNRGLELPDDTAAFLLRHYPRDLKSLCRVLDTLDAASLAKRRRLTIPFIKSNLDPNRGTC